MKKTLLIFASGFVCAAALLFIFAGANGSDSTANNKSESKTESVAENNETSSTPASINQNVQVVKSPAAVSFAGEEVPLQYFDVRESLERELNAMVYGHTLTILTIRLSSRFFPEIERILAEQGIPDDFKYLCVAESNLQNVVSPARAAGFWQFVPATVKQYGLEINDEVDERYNLEKSTRAACKYLKEAYARYGNWTLAAASYNTGMGNIDKQKTNQNTSNYYDMWLNAETARYIFRMVSYKLIMSNPEQYGFNIPPQDRFAPFEYSRKTINAPIASIADFAQMHGTNYKMIKLLNPWLRKELLTNKTGKTYIIKIPSDNFRY